MNRYIELGEELDRMLEARRAVSDGPSGLVPQRGKEAEWDALDKRAAELREEMRRVRYGGT